MYYFPDYIIKSIVIPITDSKAKSYKVNLIYERIFAIITEIKRQHQKEMTGYQERDDLWPHGRTIKHM